MFIDCFFCTVHFTRNPPHVSSSLIYRTNNTVRIFDDCAGGTTRSSCCARSQPLFPVLAAQSPNILTVLGAEYRPWGPLCIFLRSFIASSVWGIIILLSAVSDTLYICSEWETKFHTQKKKTLLFIVLVQHMFSGPKVEVSCRSVGLLCSCLRIRDEEPNVATGHLALLLFVPEVSTRRPDVRKRFFIVFLSPFRQIPG